MDWTVVRHALVLFCAVVKSRLDLAPSPVVVGGGMRSSGCECDVSVDVSVGVSVDSQWTTKEGAGRS